MKHYVCSDIHGLWVRYERAIEKITNEDRLYILGDVIDRGADGIKILLDIMKRDNVRLLIGNHEYMMLQALKYNNQRVKYIWTDMRNGGGVTLGEFCKLDILKQRALLDFLDNCVLETEITVDGHVFLLTHSAYVADAVDKTFAQVSESDRFYITWHSPLRQDMYAPIGSYDQSKTFIIGHVPVQNLEIDQIYQFGNIIDIDCGCAKAHLIDGTSLALLCLETMQTDYIDVLPPEWDDLTMYL